MTWAAVLLSALLLPPAAGLSPQQGGVIEGRVLGSTGETLDAEVVITGARLPEAVRSFTGPDGRFRTRTLAPGDYRLRFEAFGHAEAVDEGAGRGGP